MSRVGVRLKIAFKIRCGEKVPKAAFVASESFDVKVVCSGRAITKGIDES